MVIGNLSRNSIKLLKKSNNFIKRLHIRKVYTNWNNSLHTYNWSPYPLFIFIIQSLYPQFISYVSFLYRIIFNQLWPVWTRSTLYVGYPNSAWLWLLPLSLSLYFHLNNLYFVKLNWCLFIFILNENVTYSFNYSMIIIV